MAHDPNPAIELLVSQIAELERKANSYRASVNVLCERDGLPPLFPGNGGGGGGSMNGAAQAREGSAPASVQIKSDTFYGKGQQTAVRELLAIRKGAGLGPAKPNEILEALRAGGYQVEAKSDEIALVGLRAMLRKRTAIFHKLPNGTWGLKEWYPNAKAAKDATEKPAAAAKEGTTAPSDKAETVEETKTADTDEASAA